MISETENYQRVAKSARKLWTIHACISTLILLGIACGVYFIVYEHLWIFGLVALEAIFAIGIKPSIEYRQWRYLIGEERIELIHGIFFTQRTLIPINRIQHLKIQQGILQKRFDLASVDIYTAGGSHQIQALRYVEADGIVRKLNHFVVEEASQKEATVMEREVSNEAEA